MNFAEIADRIDIMADDYTRKMRLEPNADARDRQYHKGVGFGLLRGASTMRQAVKEKPDITLDEMRAGMMLLANGYTKTIKERGPSSKRERAYYGGVAVGLSKVVELLMMAIRDVPEFKI